MKKNPILEEIRRKMSLMVIDTKYPIKVKESKRYLLIIEIQDKKKTTHFWLPNGKYDGYCREVKNKS